jgi:hypothetical protein|nr:YXWGXW repeat-containing protein [Kofleriaceae bacterium]
MGPRASVGEPSAEYVSGMPPDPLYEQEPAAPGDGYVWIDGYWHWNGDEWVWVGGRWEQQQDGYVYVEPYYNYVDGSYIYTPGYWRNGANLPSGWVVTRDPGAGRPPVVRPPKSYVPVRGGVGRAPVGGGGGGGTGRAPVYGGGTSPYGPVAPSRGINQPGGNEGVYSPPIERRPEREQPIEREPQAPEHVPTYGNGGNGPEPEPQEPVIVPREPSREGHAPAQYVPPPSAPPSGGYRPSGPVRQAPPPPPPPPQRAPPPPQSHGNAPAHATSGHR